jgi:hypothetical protein
MSAPNHTHYQMFAWTVEAYELPSDETPEAIFEVNARSEGEALEWVRRERDASNYQRLVVKPGQAGVIRFTSVEKRKAPPKRGYSQR